MRVKTSSAQEGAGLQVIYPLPFPFSLFFSLPFPSFPVPSIPRAGRGRGTGGAAGARSGRGARGE